MAQDGSVTFGHPLFFVVCQASISCFECALLLFAIRKWPRPPDCFPCCYLTHAQALFLSTVELLLDVGPVSKPRGLPPLSPAPFWIVVLPFCCSEFGFMVVANAVETLNDKLGVAKFGSCHHRLCQPGYQTST